MPKGSKKGGSKGKSPMNLSDVSTQSLVVLFGIVASTITVPLIPVVILADGHGAEQYLGSFIHEMCGADNLFTVKLVFAKGLSVSELTESEGRGPQLLADVYRERPSICIVAVGANDISSYKGRGKTAQDLGRDLIDLGKRLQHHNIIPFWLSIPPRRKCGMDTKDYRTECGKTNKFLQRRAKDRRLIGLPVGKLTAQLLEDGVYFTQKGYHLIASAIYERLMEFHTILIDRTSKPVASNIREEEPRDQPAILEIIGDPVPSTSRQDQPRDTTGELITSVALQTAIDQAIVIPPGSPLDSVTLPTEQPRPPTAIHPRPVLRVNPTQVSPERQAQIAEDRQRVVRRTIPRRINFSEIVNPLQHLVGDFQHLVGDLKAKSGHPGEPLRPRPPPLEIIEISSDEEMQEESNSVEEMQEESNSDEEM